MRFQLPAADELRNGAVEHEGIENIDVIRHKEGRSVGIEAGRAADFDSCARKKHNAAAESTLQPIVFAGIQKNPEKDEQRRNYTVDHDIDGFFDLEFDVAHRAARCERVFDVCAVVQPRQHTEKAQPSDGSPLHKLNVTIGGVRVRRDEHRAARVLAVIESQKKRAAFVPFLILIAAEGEGTPAQLHDTNKNSQKITKVAEWFEHAIGKRGDIGGEANA